MKGQKWRSGGNAATMKNMDKRKRKPPVGRKTRPRSRKYRNGESIGSDDNRSVEASQSLPEEKAEVCEDGRTENAVAYLDPVTNRFKKGNPGRRSAKSAGPLGPGRGRGKGSWSEVKKAFREVAATDVKAFARKLKKDSPSMFVQFLSSLNKYEDAEVDPEITIITSTPGYFDGELTESDEEPDKPAATAAEQEAKSAEIDKEAKRLTEPDPPQSPQPPVKKHYDPMLDPDSVSFMDGWTHVGDVSEGLDEYR